jgi:hypothetical protein
MAGANFCVPNSIQGKVRGTHPFAKIAKGWGTLGYTALRKGGPPAPSNTMGNNEIQRVQAIQLFMEESARPCFDHKDIEQLRILIRVTVEFHDYLRSAPPWPQFPDDPFHDITYAIDKILINIDSFRTVLHSYGILVGSARSAIDWKAVEVESVRDRFLSLYPEFVAETKFENKCRLLLDLFKLQIVFAGAFYDCMG